MDSLLISDLERYYIIQGAELGCRIDGRTSNEYRPIELETGMLSHANGSASIRVGQTHILACVKMEVGKPLLAKPNRGYLEINVECYPTAISTVMEKRASDLAGNLKTTLQSTYRSDLWNLDSLCIQPGRQCWVVYVDLLLLEGGGNFLDAASIVIKAALMNAVLPFSTKHLNQCVVPSSKDVGACDTDNSSSAASFRPALLACLDVDCLPLFVTVHKIGNSHLVDASREEEACSLSRLSVVTYPDGTVGDLLQEGCGSCYVDTIVEMTKLAKLVGCEMHETLTRTVQLEADLRL